MPLQVPRKIRKVLVPDAAHKRGVQGRELPCEDAKVGDGEVLMVLNAGEGVERARTVVEVATEGVVHPVERAVLGTLEGSIFGDPLGTPPFRPFEQTAPNGSKTGLVRRGSLSSNFF